MKRNWIFIAVLCFIPYSLFTSVSDVKNNVEKKEEEKVAEEFRKVVTLTTYSVTEGDSLQLHIIFLLINLISHVL